jgi:hypothetical protein
MDFLYNCFYFFRNTYYTIFKKKSYDNNIKLFLEKLYTNWNNTTPNDSVYYDVLNMYIKHNNQGIYTDDYNMILKELRTLENNKLNNLELDINEHMKYYIVGWYFLNIGKIYNENSL